MSLHKISPRKRLWETVIQDEILRWVQKNERRKINSCCEVYWKYTTRVRRSFVFFCLFASRTFHFVSPYKMRFILFSVTIWFEVRSLYINKLCALCHLNKVHIISQLCRISTYSTKYRLCIITQNTLYFIY